MSYVKNEWKRGDIVTAEKLNHMEDGIAGGWPADLPKPSVGGYGYTEQGWTTLVSEAVTTTVTAQMPFASGEFATGGLEIKDGTTYKVVFNGTEYELTAVEDNGQTYIGELDETRMPNFNTYPFCILQDIGDSPILMATVSSGTHDVTIQLVADTIHKIDEKYLPLIPTAPSDDGTYTLTCTVTDGEPVYSWES